MTTPLARQLKRAMDAQDINQVGLSVLSKVDQSTISKLLKGKVSNPGMDLVVALARALNVSLDWLVNGAMWEQDALTPEEQQIIDDYRAIREPVKSAIVAMLREAARRSR